jgi:hypothetical protein
MTQASWTRRMFLRGGRLAVAGTLAALSAVASLAEGNGDDEDPFLAENDVAMSRMMADMGVTPSGDVDHDFLAMMIPHHQGAIDMAKAVLRYGKDEQVRRIAQGIVVEQEQEIAVMRLLMQRTTPVPRAPALPPSQRLDSPPLHHTSMQAQPKEMQ